MILPQPRKDKVSQRGKAFVSTLLLAALFYVGLMFSSISFEKPSRSIFREVDLASFKPPAITPEEEETPSESPEEVEAEEVESEPVLEEAPVQSLDQLDLAELFPEDLSVDVSPDPGQETARNARVDAIQATEEIEVQSGGLQGLGSLDALDDLGAPVPTSRGRRSRQNESGGGGISIASGSGTVSPDQNLSGGQNTQVVGENTRRAATAEDADFDVPRMSLDAFGANYDNLEVLALIEWMKANPGELPIGVRKLVRHRDEFLTSKTSFALEGKTYELFLMCKPRLKEIHIVLVDVDDATYLIDRSFQKLNTYLREGKVGRTAELGISAINSQRTAASNDRSKEFYSLFLSWWEIAKAE